MRRHDARNQAFEDAIIKIRSMDFPCPKHEVPERFSCWWCTRSRVIQDAAFAVQSLIFEVPQG